jgi:hypothetical protein
MELSKLAEKVLGETTGDRSRDPSTCGAAPGRNELFVFIVLVKGTRANDFHASVRVTPSLYNYPFYVLDVLLEARRPRRYRYSYATDTSRNVQWFFFCKEDETQEIALQNLYAHARRKNATSTLHRVSARPSKDSVLSRMGHLWLRTCSGNGLIWTAYERILSLHSIACPPKRIFFFIFSPHIARCQFWNTLISEQERK